MKEDKKGRVEIMSRNARNAGSTLINVSKCSAKSNRKPPRCNFRVSVCAWVIF